MATQRPSPFVGLTRAGLTVAVAAGLSRVFADGAWPFAAVGAAAIPHAIIGYGDRRRWGALVLLLALVVAGFGLSLYVVEVDTLRGVLPTGDTFRMYRDHLVDAPEILRAAVVPVAPVGSALLLSLLSLFVAGAVAEWSARRLDVTFGAVGPSLVVFVAVAALGDGPWAVTTAVYALAVAAYLLALHATELADRRSWFHSSHTRPSRTTAGGSVAAVAIVIVAAIIAPQLPGARSDALFDYRSLGDGDGRGLLSVPTPIIGLRSKLLVDPEKVVMIVESDQEAYWRITGLDQYGSEDGEEIWTLADKSDEAGDIPKAREEIVKEAPIVEQRYEIVDSDANWLPAAYRPEFISLAGARVIESSLSLYRESKEPITELSYTVKSRIARPTEEQFRNAPSSDDVEKYVELPGDVPQRVRDLAVEVTARAETQYDQVVALRDFFRDPSLFTYDLQAPEGQSIETLEQFLFDVRVGYCEQFAASFGVMARSLGIPTRVAVGFRSGENIGGGRWRVQNKNAHAWPEVYFEGLGWYPFEPTPGDGFREPTLEDAAGIGPADPAAGETTTSATATTGETGAVPPTNPQVPDDGGIEAGGVPEVAKPRSTAERVFTSVLYFLGVTLLVAVVFLTILFTMAWRRGWRRKHATDPRDRVLGAWRQALDYLAEAGIDPRPSATANEYALRFAPAQGAGDAGAPLVRLARLQTAAMFAPHPPSDTEAEEAWQHAAEIDHALASRTARVRRWFRRLDPRGRGTPELE